MKPNATAADILRPFPEDVRATAEALRVLVKKAVPTATEHPYIGWKGIGYRDPQAGYFVGIFPQPDHVRLLFEHGAMLDDPDDILRGDNVRQVRWIPLRPGQRVPRSAIERMLRRALVHGSAKKRRPR
ncbi:MAG: DUF1801 domain-containing protein [Gemmatimonadaceae bacterium]